jgi:endonuclease/exonuclease/phosphatase family metal-dependent hydrolase
MECECRIDIKKKLLAEIEVLEYELNHELPAEIKKAVAMGDLSENAEYHMAKERQTFVDARLGQLKRRMAELSLVNFWPTFPGTRPVLARRWWFTTRSRTWRLPTVW